eukprot:152001-Prymnesium_polylepis.1
MLAWGDAVEQALSSRALDGTAESSGWGASVRLEPAEEEATSPGVAKVELTLSASVGASGRIEGAIEFNTDLFERGSIERLAARLEVLAA